LEKDNFVGKFATIKDYVRISKVEIEKIVHTKKEFK
jgi:hypothetical protein